MMVLSVVGVLGVAMILGVVVVLTFGGKCGIIRV